RPARRAPRRGPWGSLDLALGRGLDAPGARRTRLGRLLALAVLLHEALEPRVVRRVELQLVAPGADDDRRVHLALVGGEQGVGVRGGLLELLHLGLGQTGLVGDPHGAVLEGVDGMLIGKGLVVDAAVHPDRVVLAAGGRRLAVVDGPLGVLEALVVVGLHAAEVTRSLALAALAPDRPADGAEDEGDDETRGPDEEDGPPALGRVLCLAGLGELGVAGGRGRRLLLAHVSLGV